MGDRPDLIYVAGITPRSGSNYLFDLLSRHPSCAPVADGEDYFLLKLYYLRLFVESVYRKWDADWEMKEQTAPSELMAALGEGLRQFLRNKSTAEGTDGARDIVLTKTPHPRNIQFFPSVFENGFLVLLTRDGRAVTESAQRTFDDSFDDAATMWRRGARQALDFIAEHGRSSDWHETVKYEDLVRDTSTVLRELFHSAGLNAEAYPYDSLEETEVIGSSTFGKREGDVTWDKKQDDGTFDPLSRFDSWEASEHERFEWIAGEELRGLGYSSSTSLSLGQSIWHRLLDVRHLPDAGLRYARAKLKEALKKRVTDEGLI